jgi:hypothetical protein
MLVSASLSYHDAGSATNPQVQKVGQLLPGILQNVRHE